MLYDKFYHKSFHTRRLRPEKLNDLLNITYLVKNEARNWMQKSCPHNMYSYTTLSHIHKGLNLYKVWNLYPSEHFSLQCQHNVDPHYSALHRFWPTENWEKCVVLLTSFTGFGITHSFPFSLVIFTYFPRVCLELTSVWKDCPFTHRHYITEK